MRSDPVSVGRAALREGRWGDARTAFEEALAVEASADALEGLADAHWWLSDARASVKCRERAYVKLREQGDAARACRVALDLCTHYLVSLGDEAVARGWLARAERLAAELDTHPVQGWVLLMQAFVNGDPDRIRRALAFARASGDVDLELTALADLGSMLVASGEVAEGIRMLDEAMAGTLGGEYQRLDTVVYASCNMLTACSMIGDLDRATQWCRAADEFMRTFGCPFLFARCRTHYGTLLLATGRWTDAEGELRAALDMSEDAGPGPRAEAAARLATLRLRQGRLEEAEALLERARDDASAVLPAAEAHLARGDVGAAVAILERRASELEDTPVESVPVLALLVDAHLARDAVDEAAAVADRLAGMEAAHPYAPALSALAAARVARVRRTGAVAAFEAALRRFSELDLPLETARVRLELARVLADTNPAAAIAEARTALAVFDRLGAQPDADACAALMRELGYGGRTGPKGDDVLTKREREVLALVGIGLSNPEIARRLFISPKTASHHVSSILAKLGVRNRAEAVAYAARTDVQPTDPRA